VRDLLVTCPTSGEAFSALSGPDTCHCCIAVQTVSASADICVPIVRERGELVEQLWVRADVEKQTPEQKDGVLPFLRPRREMSSATFLGAIQSRNTTRSSAVR
jgi:hypothetical protein